MFNFINQNSTMKILFYLMIVFSIFSCTSDKKERPSTALDTGRMFINDCMNGDFESAEPLLLQDSTNNQLFTAFKEYYNKMPAEKKQHYKTDSYQINKYSDLNDTTTIINYSNDYMNKPMEIKIVRQHEIWCVDFKYTYSGNLPIN